MFLVLVGASLTVGSALLAAVMFTDGVYLGPRTAAQIIGWLFIAATLAGLAGLRRASPDRMVAVAVTLCAGIALLYLTYFSDSREIAPAASVPVMPAAEAPRPEPAPQHAALQPKTIVAAPAADACSGLTGLESLQCDRCSDKTAFAWINCQEQVRLEFCESDVGEERSCPSPIPAAYPG